MRDAFFDNAKLFLIFLVVFGHIIQPFTSDSEMMQVIYQYIYLFHMPAFILLSGFFAKGKGEVGYVWNLARKLLFPYLVFQVLYSSFFFLIGNASWRTSIFEPHWSLWFLLSLFSWHLLLALFKKIPPIFGIVIAVEIGIIAGYISGFGHEYSLSRTFVFFPFFLIGYWITKEQITQLTRPVVKYLSLFVLSVVMIALVYAPSFSTNWLLGSVSFSDLNAPVMGGFYRLGIYIVATLLTFGIFAWIPRRHFQLTKLGKQTLYVYLLHGLFIQSFREAGWFKVDNVIDVFGLAIISFLIVLLLSSRAISVPFQPFIEGKLTQIKQLIAERKTRKSNQMEYY